MKLHPRQASFPFLNTKRFPSGKRRGRPPKKSKERGVPHGKRPAVSPRFPVMVSLRVRDELPFLRSEEAMERIHAACFAAKERWGMRITDYSVLGDHLHVIVELNPKAADAPGRGLAPAEAAKLCLAKGMRCLKVRMARGLNRAWNRKGPVFAGRYHAVPKKTPLEVKRAKEYVLLNAHRHRMMGRRVDWWFSSGPWFRHWTVSLPERKGPAPVVEPKTWLGAVGWVNYHGPIAVRG